MIRSILVTTSGSSSDESVFATAIAVARPLGAHMDFYHVYVTAGEAACHAPHFGSAIGSGIAHSLRDLHALQGALSVEAKKHFVAFCDAQQVVVSTKAPAPSRTVTAQYTEEVDQPSQRILARARQNDLVIFGRSQHFNCLPSGLFEDLLLGCSRPVLIAADRPPKDLLKTVLVAWNQSAASERALTAALPLLKHSARVVILAVGDIVNGQSPLDNVKTHLAWHGIHAETQFIKDCSARALARIGAVAGEIGAAMIVLGGYGHSPLHEAILGGVTAEFMARAQVPVFMMH